MFPLVVYAFGVISKIIPLPNPWLLMYTPMFVYTVKRGLNFNSFRCGYLVVPAQFTERLFLHHWIVLAHLCKTKWPYIYAQSMYSWPYISVGSTFLTELNMDQNYLGNNLHSQTIFPVIIPYTVQFSNDLHGIYIRYYKLYWKDLKYTGGILCKYYAILHKGFKQPMQILVSTRHPRTNPSQTDMDDLPSNKVILIYTHITNVWEHLFALQFL